MKYWSRRKAKIIKNSDQYVVELFEKECDGTKRSALCVLFE